MGLFDKKPDNVNINPNDFIAGLSMNRVEIPKLTESANYKFINYGANNAYPQYLVELSKTSALHRTLIENKAKMVAGGDITINDLQIDAYIDTLNGTQQMRVQNLFYNSKYPLRDWLKRTAYDYQLFGAYTTEVIWSNDFEFIKIMKHIDTSKIRSGAYNKNGEVDTFYFSRNWTTWQTKNITPIAIFDTEDDQNLNQLIYKKNYYPDLEYYSLPDYIGGLSYINLDSELGLFNLSHIQNGLNPGLIFKLPFQFKSTEEKAAFMLEFMNHYQGARNNKNPLILAKNGDQSWDIEKVEVPNFDAQLIALADHILQELIFAHRITNGALVGLQTSGKLGTTNAEELEFSASQFDKFVIEPARLMLEETVEDVMRTHGLDVKVKIIN